MHIEIVKQINQLPIPERVEIIEEVSRGVRRDMKSSGDEVMAEEKKKLRSEAIRRLKGIASVPGKQPSTDEEWLEDRINYLSEKHK